VLSDIGVSSGIVDFSGGPADLAELPDLPVRAVRLTPRLVAAQRRRTRLPVADSLRLLIDFVHAAGKRVAVDGLRTAGQADWWEQAGADIGVGPFFGSPGDLAKVLGRS